MGLFCKSRLNKDKFCCHKTLNPATFTGGGGKPGSPIPGLCFGGCRLEFGQGSGSHSIFSQGVGSRETLTRPVLPRPHQCCPCFRPVFQGLIFRHLFPPPNAVVTGILGPVLSPEVTRLELRSLTCSTAELTVTSVRDVDSSAPAKVMSALLKRKR